MSSTTVERDLDTSARCDRCGAQAYMRVTLGNGGELLFCAHHGKTHKSKLEQVAVRIDDQSDRI